MTGQINEYALNGPHWVVPAKKVILLIKELVKV